jgi:hypothetical protein
LRVAWRSATDLEADRVTIELLFFDGCPSHERLVPLVRELAASTGTIVVLRRIESPEQAEHERFLGSPTVRVDGSDVDPGAAERTDYGLKCRIYRSEELGQSPLPPAEWIRAALERKRG